MSDGMKVCSRADCPHGGAAQPVSNFFRNRSQPDGRDYYCVECRKVAAQGDRTAAQAARPQARRERGRRMSEPEWYTARHGDVAAAFIRNAAAPEPEARTHDEGDETKLAVPVSLAEHRTV